MDIKSIQESFKRLANKEAKESWKKFIPTAEKFYGVYIPEVNKLVSKSCASSFDLTEELNKF